MTIHIGIVEDNFLCQDQLQNQLKKWLSENDCEAVYYTKTSAEDFLLHLPKQLDILFLDIQLYQMSGLELAQQLRNKNCNCEIVFLTAFQEYVFEGYQVQALNYLLKPAPYIKVKKCMDWVLDHLKSKHYIFKKQHMIYKIPYSDIIYFTSFKHYVEIIATKETYKQLEALKNILPHLPSQFMRCHRTTIVNIKHIQCINSTCITMSNNTILPVSKTYRNSIRERFMESII